MKNILFFPIWSCSPHIETEFEIIINEIIKGNKIFFLFCNKDLSICDNNINNEKKICIKCKKIKLKAINLINAKYAKKIYLIPLNKYIKNINKSNKQSIESINFNDINELKQISYNSFEIGYGITSTLANELDTSSLDDKLRKKIYKLYTNSKFFYDCIQLIIKDFSISLGYILNGRFSFSKAFFQAFVNNKITIFTHERGSTYDKYEIFKNSLPHNINNFTQNVNEYWNNHNDYFFKKNIADIFFKKRYIGADTNYISFTSNQILLKLPAEINKYKRKVVIFTSSDFEFDYISNEYTYKYYKSQADGIKKIVDSLKDDNDIGVFLREHPYQKNRINFQRQELRNITANNLFLIPAESDISSYNILFNADIVITFNSTIGIEATYWNIPSILCSNAIYENLNIAYMPSSHEETVQLIKSHIKPINNDDIYKVGYYFATFGIKFKYYKPIDFWNGLFLGVNLNITKKIKLIEFIKIYFPLLYYKLKNIKNKLLNNT